MYGRVTILKLDAAIRAHPQRVLPKSSVHLKVGRAVPSAPREVAKTRTFRRASDARGALGTARLKA